MVRECKYIFIIITIFIFFVGCKPNNSYEDVYFRPSYKIKTLGLGIAYPPVRNSTEVNFSITKLKDLGIDKVRISDLWELREPISGDFNWDVLDMKLNSFYNAGISVLLTIENSWPSWLNSTGNHCEQQTLDAFRNYVSELLIRYSDKIDKIQYGNEWDWAIDDFFDGDESAFVRYNNILYEEVQSLSVNRKPIVVLGSFSGGTKLAADQELIDKVYIEEVQVYVQATHNYLNLPLSQRITVRVENILTNSQYDMLDIHLYDDYKAWSKYVQAYISSNLKCKSINTPILVSEFGGPYPNELYNIFGNPSPDLLAKRLEDYVKILDDIINIEEAYFFKLVEGGNNVFHSDSYLINSKLEKMSAYNTMKYFGKQ